MACEQYVIDTRYTQLKIQGIASIACTLLDRLQAPRNRLLEVAIGCHAGKLVSLNFHSLLQNFPVRRDELLTKYQQSCAAWSPGMGHVMDAALLVSEAHCAC
jgi:RNase adaptor protein for sRNA GlmZ degradation